MEARAQADVRLAPLAVGLWFAESVTLACSGRADGPAPAAVAGWLAAGAIAVSLGVAVMACLRGRRRSSPGTERARPGTVGRQPPRGTGRMVAALLCGMGIVIGALLAVGHAAALQPDPVAQLVRARAVVDAELVINSEPVTSEVATNFAGVSRRWRLRASTAVIREGERVWHIDVPVSLVGTDRSADARPPLHVGMRVRVQAAVLAPQAARPEAMRLAARAPPRVMEPAPWWERGALAFRESMRAAASELPAGARGLLPGLVVGDDSGLEPATATAMRTVGMSHLTAVSGSNLAIVTGLVLLVARRLGMGRRYAVGAALLAMTAFVIVVGPQPSVLRATVMATIALGCLAGGRHRTGSSALLSSVVILLLVDPWLALNWGFALSVAATAGLLAWSLRMRWTQDERGPTPGCAQGRSGWKQALRSAVAVAAVCALATAPLVAALGGGIPLVGVVANAAAVPAVPIATVLGLAAASVGLVWPAGADWLAIPAGYAAMWITAVARFAESVPGGVIPWPDGLAGGLSLTALLLVASLTAWRIRVWERSRSGTRCRSAVTRQAVIGVALVVVLVATLLTRAGNALGGWPPPNWLIAFCDVGQGDAVVLRSSPGHVVMVDVGPEPRAADRCLSDLGIDVIDVLVLTHFHADHVEGLSGAANGRHIGRVLVSPVRDPPLEAERVDRWLDEDHAVVAQAPLGEIGQVGDVWYQVVWPRRVIHDGSVPNNSSVTLVARVRDLTVLLPGDLEAEAQAELMAAIPSPHALVTKIPHHGSRNQDPNLPEWSQSRVAVASVGRQNMYGHPSQQTLDSWRRVGATVKRTDLDGDVIIWCDDAGELNVRGRSEAR